MKTILSTTLFLLMGLLTFAQTPCDGGRYSSDVFTNVTVTSNVTYGQNTDFIGSNTTLTMDIYEPTGDTLTERPLIVWAHGGSFIGGSKTDSDMTTLCNAFAKKGYVCASINYRVGMWPVDSTNAIKALLRSVQDMKAAVRFFYMDRATTDSYMIDTTQIYVGGSSAGAIMSLHYAYLDKECEAEEYLSLSALNSMGGLEGTSGNPGYSTDVQGVINLCGAVARYGYLEPGDIPFCSLHGNNDGTVPYNHGSANVSGIDVLTLDGSRMLDSQADIVGVNHNFFTYYNAGHVPYVGNGASMDTTINFVRDFLIQNMGCTDAALQPENTPLETTNLYQLNYCGLDVAEQDFEYSVYPVPSQGTVTISWPSTENVSQIIISDLNGKILQRTSTESNQSELTIENLTSGVYIVNVELYNGSKGISRILVE